jgi:hypothetical protein
MSDEEYKGLSALEELEIQIHNETVIAMYLMDQLNGKKKFIHELYEIERALKNETMTGG